MLKKLTICIVVILCTTPAFADGLDSQHKAWNVFSITQESNKICYITSSPIKEGGTWKNRNDPYMLVTYRDNGLSEVSVSSGYPYKKGSKVEVATDKKNTYSFFTSEDTPKIAWAKDITEDKKVVKSMVKGARITVKGSSKKGTWSKDTYSLYGFTNAYKRMQELCDSLRMPASTPVMVPSSDAGSKSSAEAEGDASVAK